MENPRAPARAKAKNDDIAGHVGHEDVPEHQVAEGVDEPGDHRQAEQQRGQGTVSVPRSGRDGLPDAVEEGLHPATALPAVSPISWRPRSNPNSATTPANAVIPHMT